MFKLVGYLEKAMDMRGSVKKDVEYIN
jgi:hypothetical protein